MLIDIGLQRKDRKLIADSLNGILADKYFLLIKTQGYRWNVVGHSFHGLYDLLGQCHQELSIAIDQVAMRIRSIGQPCPGSYSEMVRITAIKEDPHISESTDMIRSLVLDNEMVIRRSHEVQELAQSVNDPVSSELMLARMRAHGQTAWLLRSFLE
ncbi:MAG: ferritin-like domain-containing protein [Alphaproteobacteria bacterium]|nr:ferritin-like domain-containing protein [Alphaproteobacteria bacterium]